MHQRVVCRVIPLVLVAMVAATLMSCATTPVRPVVVLPNDYYLQPDDSKQSEIVKRDGRLVVPAPIAAYAVFGEIVAGALGPVSPSSGQYVDLAFTGNSNTRYFVLDTATGEVESNLDHADWQRRLKALNVPSDFEILPPLPWQQ